MLERAARPELGTSPSATIPSPHPSGYLPRIRVRGRPFDRRSDGCGGWWGAPGARYWCRESVPEAIPDRSPGHAFIRNRSCRLGPAHQGMKSRSCGMVQRIGTVGSATPHPDPSGGRAPALHSPLPTPSGFQPRIRVRGMLLIAGMTSWVAGVYPGSWSGTCSRTNGELRGRLSHPG